MPCNQLTQVKQLSVESPETLDSIEWQTHFSNCVICKTEHQLFNKSLETFLRLENEAMGQIPPIQIWDKLEPQLKKKNALVKKVLT